MIVFTHRHKSTLDDFKGRLHPFSGKVQARMHLETTGPLPMIVDVQKARFVKALIVLITPEEYMRPQLKQSPTIVHALAMPDHC